MSIARVRKGMGIMPPNLRCSISEWLMNFGECILRFRCQMTLNLGSSRRNKTFSRAYKYLQTHACIKRRWKNDRQTETMPVLRVKGVPRQCGLRLWDIMPHLRSDINWGWHSYHYQNLEFQNKTRNFTVYFNKWRNGWWRQSQSDNLIGTISSQRKHYKHESFTIWIQIQKVKQWTVKSMTIS